MEKGRIKNGDAVFNATVSSEEALQQEMCLNDVPLKVRGVAFLLWLLKEFYTSICKVNRYAFSKNRSTEKNNETWELSYE